MRNGDGEIDACVLGDYLEEDEDGDEDVVNG